VNIDHVKVNIDHVTVNDDHVTVNDDHVTVTDGHEICGFLVIATLALRPAQIQLACTITGSTANCAKRVFNRRFDVY